MTRLLAAMSRQKRIGLSDMKTLDDFKNFFKEADIGFRHEDIISPQEKGMCQTESLICEVGVHSSLEGFSKSKVTFLFDKKTREFFSMVIT